MSLAGGGTASCWCVCARLPSLLSGSTAVSFIVAVCVQGCLGAGAEQLVKPPHFNGRCLTLTQQREDCLRATTTAGGGIEGVSLAGAALHACAMHQTGAVFHPRLPALLLMLR